MKKIILLIVSVLSLIASTQVSAKFDPENIPIRVNRPGGYIPHAPALVPISCNVDEDVLSIYVSFLTDLGNVTITVENLTTGEYGQTAVNSALGGAIIPFSGSSGSWVITFTLASGEEYIGEFEV